jgi:hypothetical protein
MLVTSAPVKAARQRTATLGSSLLVSSRARNWMPSDTMTWTQLFSPISLPDQ